MTRLRRRSTIVSTCSMSTGHSCTHAPHVTQSHTTSSVTAFGTSGCSSTIARGGGRQDRRRFGDHVVAQAHDQQLRRRAACRCSRRGRPPGSGRTRCTRTGRAPACATGRWRPRRRTGVSSSGALQVDPQRLQPCRSAPFFARYTFGAAVRMCRCFDFGRYVEEAEHQQQVRPHEDPLRRLGRPAAAQNSDESAFATGRRAGWSAYCRARSGARSTAAAWRRWRGSRGGSGPPPACGSRGSGPAAAPCGSKKAIADADDHEGREQVGEEGEPRGVAEARQRPGRVRSTASIASTIVGSRTRNPQKMNACISAGDRLLEELALAEDLGQLAASPRAGPVGATRRTSRAHDVQPRPRAAHEERDGDRQHGRRAPARSGAGASADLLGEGGDTWKRSPTTPRSAIFRIGASASLLIATMRFAPFIPTTCWRAPLMPTAM